MHNKTVVKSMEIIQVFYDQERASLTELMSRTGLPKTSVHRMAETLVEMKFLEKDADGLYRLGLLFLTLGHLVAERLDIRQIALPFMNDLRTEYGEAVNLVVQDGMEAIYIEKADTKERIRVYTQIGRRAPLYAGACPRAILAYLPEEERTDLLSEFTYKQYAAGTPTTVEEVQAKIDETRERGWSLSHSELETHSSAIGVPIFNHTGNVMAGLSFVGPEVRFQDKHRVEKLANELQQAAKSISLQLGAKEEMLNEVY